MTARVTRGTASALVTDDGEELLIEFEEPAAFDPAKTRVMSQAELREAIYQSLKVLGKPAGGEK